MTKPVGCSLIAIIIIMLSSAALAAPTECRFINSRKERNACYEKQEAAAKRGPKAPDRAKMEHSIELLKKENDLLNSRLKGICRGC